MASTIFAAPLIFPASVTFVVHVTADNRYQLFVNGERVVAGPPGATLSLQYETVDLAPVLRAGRTFWQQWSGNFGSWRGAQVTSQTGFLLQATDMQTEE